MHKGEACGALAVRQRRGAGGKCSGIGLRESGNLRIGAKAEFRQPTTCLSLYGLDFVFNHRLLRAFFVRV